MGRNRIQAASILGFIGLASLVLWISILIFGNYLIPSLYPSVVRAITFSIFAIFAGYGIIEEGNGYGALYVYWTLAWIALVMAIWRNEEDELIRCVFWVIFMLTSLIICAIIWIATKVERAARAAKKEIKRVAKNVEKEVTQFLEDIINGLIDLFSIRESVRMKCPGALKAQILEKKKNAVNVGIFGINDVMIAKEEIISSEGVSQDIYKGQIIYC